MSKIVIIKKRNTTNLNKWIPFGRFEINLTKFNNNIFSVRYKQSKGNVISNFTMHPEFKRCINTVIKDTLRS